MNAHGQDDEKHSRKLVRAGDRTSMQTCLSSHMAVSERCCGLELRQCYLATVRKLIRNVLAPLVLGSSMGRLSIVSISVLVLFVLAFVPLAMAAGGDMDVYKYSMDGYGSFLGNLDGCDHYSDSSVATWNTQYVSGDYKCRFYVYARIPCPQGETDFSQITFWWCLQASTWFGIPVTFSFKIYAYKYDSSSWEEIESKTGVSGYQQGAEPYSTNITTRWTTQYQSGGTWYRESIIRVYVFSTVGLWVNVEYLNAPLYWT